MGKGIIAVIPWMIAIFVLIYVLGLRFPLDGTVQFSHAFDGSGIWFTPFEPGERVTSPGAQDEGWRGQRILDEPVYASARWPGVYDDLSLSFEMKTVRQPLVEIGLLRDEATRAFEMKPLWSDTLMSDEWREVEIEGMHGFVRADLPDEALLETRPEYLMTWLASTTKRQPGDTGEAAVKRYEVSFRGTHHFHALPINDELFFKFELQDVNRNREGKNTAAMRVTCDDEIIWTSAGSVSGLNDARPSDIFTEEIRLTDLEPCAYRISFLADNDFFIREIQTTAKHWVIGPEIFFGDRVGYRTTSTPAIAWTNSQHAVATAVHHEGLQDLLFGREIISLRETHNTYAMKRHAEERGGKIRLEAPEGNIRLIGDGYFSLAEEALFYPGPRRLTSESNPAEEGIRAILTSYTKPRKQSQDFWQATVDFELPQDKDKLQFSLAAPGIDRSNGAVDIRHVELLYARPALSLREWFVRVKREISLALKRI